MGIGAKGPLRWFAVLMACMAIVFVLAPSPTTTLSTGITRRGAAQIRQVGMLGEGGLLDAAWSPDGSTLALASTAGVWVRDGAELDAAPRLLDDPLRIVAAVAFSPAGDLLAASDEGGTIWLWDATTWALRGTMARSATATSDYAQTLCFSPDGQYLAEGRATGVRLWDVARGELVARLPGMSEHVHGIAFNPSGDLLGVSDDDGVRVWSVPDATEPTDLQLSPMPVLDAVTFSADGRYLLMNVAAWEQTRFGDFRRLDDDEHAALLDDPAMALFFNFDGYAFREERGPIAAETVRDWAALMARSDLTPQDWFALARFPIPTGDRIVLSLYDEWEVWTTGPVARINTLRSDLNGITQMALSDDARCAIVTSGESARVWRLGQGTSRVIDLHDSGGYLPDVFWRDGQALGLFVDWTSGARLLDLDTGAALMAFDGLAVNDAMAISDDVGFFAARRLDGSTAVWDLRTGALLTSLTPPDPVYSYLPLAFSADGRTLATAQLDPACVCHTIALWDVTTGTQAAELGDLAYFANGAQFSADGSLLVVGGGGIRDAGEGHYSVMVSELAVWNVAAGEIVAHYDTALNSIIHDVTLSPDARYVAGIGYADVWLWDLHAPQDDALRLVMASQAESDEYASAAFNAAGDLLAVGTASGEILLFDVRNGGRVAALAGHTSRVRALHFSADGRMMVSGAQDGTVRLWRADGQPVGSVTRTELAAPSPVPMTPTPTLTPPSTPTAALQAP
ncbi:WD40 repeat domain-containing protein [Aggregatilinea lenta]|uniref:WD40 repeat domain-containing protein n=1 Tax=Aggregatilinea lenta TaxID=913108 RepID=UPI000E5B94E0|nr:WD40 repeat domain-containing protein [Aggregatilinea lenta]